MDKQVLSKISGLDNQENNQNQPNSTRTTRTTAKTNVLAKSKSNAHPRSKSCSADPRVYSMAEFYKQRKELQLKKIKDEEEKLRRHKAKPMPNFKAIHLKTTLTTTKGSVEVCMSPETPEVLKRGLAMKEKQKQKIKEYEAKLVERPPIVTRSARVLTEEPFKPKLEPHQELKIVPFNLGMENRLLQRKEFDENYQRQLTEKKQKEEEQKQKQENMTRQAVREKTTFKARPNPFKKAS